MQHLLYISPYFPPQARVGALRPLKFTRHLAAHGWRPIVLTDLKRDDAIDLALESQISNDTTTLRSYGWFRSGTPTGRATFSGGSGRINPELVPLGAHALDIPHALAAAHRALARFPCDAVMVNADPFAALLVGARVAERAGLPLVLDLRDPWHPASSGARSGPHRSASSSIGSSASR